MLTRLFVK